METQKIIPTQLFGAAFGLAILLLIAFAILQWLHIAAGHFLDWLIGIASFWWLIAIVTIPWNIYFGAKQVLADAVISQQKQIKLNEAHVSYVKMVASRSLWVAILLHALSALILYAIAAFEISRLGYISAIAALLLTALRPAIAFYQYLIQRLESIQQRIRYPREDVITLQQTIKGLATKVQQIQHQLNLDKPHADSWATKQQTDIQQLQSELEQLEVNFKVLKTDNQAEHQQLSQESRKAIAQLNEDSKFLENAREIIRFFKSA